MPDNIHARIAQAYQRLGIPQAEAARRCGMSAQRFSNYVTGKRLPDVQALARIAAALGTTTDALLGDSAGCDDSLAEILAQLLELEGVLAGQAAGIAEAAVEAQRLLRALPAGSDAAPRIAAQAVWRARNRP